MDIETQLRHDLAGRADDIQAAPASMFDDVVAGARHQHRRRLGALAVGACAVVAAVAIPLVVQTGPAPSTGPIAGGTTAPAVEARYEPYEVGPRGSLAGDPAYLRALLERPWSSLPEYAGPPVETRQVVFAGNVGDGVQALVIGWQNGQWTGLWLQGPTGAAPEELEPTGDATPVDPIRPLLQFLPTALLVLGEPGDTIELSANQQIAADGSITRAPFQGVEAPDGVATIPAEGLRTAQLRISRSGQVVLDTVLWGGQQYREGTAEQIDLSGALSGAVGDPDQDVVRLMVQGVLNQTGISATDVTVGVRWGGAIGNRNLPATAAVVTVGLPSGATVLLGSQANSQQVDGGDSWTTNAPCLQSILPAGTDVDGMVIVMRCDLSDLSNGASLGSQLVVVPPAGTASLRLIGTSGSVIDERSMSGPAYVGASPDGLAAVAALDGAGNVLAESPVQAVAGIQLD